MTVINLQCDICSTQFITEQNQYLKYFYCRCGKYYAISPDITHAAVWVQDSSIVSIPDIKQYNVTYVPGTIFKIFSDNMPGVWDYKDLIIGYEKPKKLTHKPIYNPPYVPEKSDYGQIELSQQYIALIKAEQQKHADIAETVKELSAKYNFPLTNETEKKPHPIIQEIAKVFPIITDRSIATKYRRCHICSLPQDCIAHLIVHLNDLHSLSREAIAEILDKMDLPGMSIHLGEKNEEPARDS